MADVPGFNKAKEGGIVLSNAFNLTRLTVLLSAVIGALTVGFGATADTPGQGSGSGPATTDVLNFDAGQRLVILVAVIAAYAVVTAADIIGRSMATGKAVSAGMIPLTTPQAAEHHTPTGDKVGFVYAVRAGEQPMYLFQSGKETPRWVAADEGVKFVRE